jgi:hypothetical protein
MEVGNTSVSPFGRSIQQVIFPSELSKKLYGRNGNMPGDFK